MRPDIRLYCIDQEWEIQVVKEYFMYYGPACMDQGTMARKGNRKKLIECCGNGEYLLSSWNHTAGVHSKKLILEQSKYDIPEVHSEKLKNALTVELQL